MYEAELAGKKIIDIFCTSSPLIFIMVYGNETKKRCVKLIYVNFYHTFRCFETDILMIFKLFIVNFLLCLK